MREPENDQSDRDIPDYIAALILLAIALFLLAAVFLTGCAAHRVQGTHYPETQGKDKPLVYEVVPIA